MDTGAPTIWRAWLTPTVCVALETTTLPVSRYRHFRRAVQSWSWLDFTVPRIHRRSAAGERWTAAGPIHQTGQSPAPPRPAAHSPDERRNIRRRRRRRPRDLYIKGKTIAPTSARRRRGPELGEIWDRIGEGEKDDVMRERWLDERREDPGGSEDNSALPPPISRNSGLQCGQFFRPAISPNSGWKWDPGGRALEAFN